MNNVVKHILCYLCLQLIIFYAIIGTKGDDKMVKNRIGKLRREFNMNQRELGEQLGVGQTTVSAWETDKTEPDNESMHKMAKLFHVSIGYLTGYENDEINRGLSKEEREALTEEIFRQRDEESFRKMIEAEGREDIDEDIIAECLERDLYQEWKKSGSTNYYEFYKLNQLGDYLTRKQRERILKVAELMFPNAVNGEYTPE